MVVADILYDIIRHKPNLDGEIQISFLLDFQDNVDCSWGFRVCAVDMEVHAFEIL